MSRLLTWVVALALAAAPLCGLAETRLLSQPTLSDDALVFVYAGDHWVTDIAGTNPRRLTTGPASESEPVISPDGTLVAFAADYESNVDVYVMPIAGGQPERLTWHPADDTPLGWTPDGTSVAFVSRSETDHGRSGQLYHVGLEGGLPQK
ncbi:MAG: peptidase S41, partial [Gammaproteobacteria bacterium]